MNPTTQAVHRYVAAYVARHGYPPTVREIARGCHLASTSGVAYHLGRLEAAGLLVRTGRQARGIQLTEG